MDLQAIKQIIGQVGFPKDTAEAIDNIIGMAAARNGELTSEELQEILNLIDDDLMKNETETKQLLDLVEAVQDVQDIIIEEAEKASKHSMSNSTV